MTLAKAEHDRLANLPTAEKHSSIQNDVDVIHRSVNSGSTDRDAVNAALERISAAVSKDTARLVANIGSPGKSYFNTTPAPGSPKPLGTPDVPG